MVGWGKVKTNGQGTGTGPMELTDVTHKKSKKHPTTTDGENKKVEPSCKNSVGGQTKPGLEKDLRNLKQGGEINIGGRPQKKWGVGTCAENLIWWQGATTLGRRGTPTTGD